MQKIVGSVIENYPQKNFDYAATAVDVVLFRVLHNELQVLLLKLKEPPYTGKCALPGGLVTHRESLEKAVLRHLKNKVGVDSHVYLEQLYSFGDPSRDPLGWVVSVSYIGLCAEHEMQLRVDDRYASAEWFSVTNLPELAYDHETIIKTAIERLASKINYTNIVCFMIRDEFTLTELQSIYETILGKKLDKRNFRKKMLSLKMLSEVSKAKTEGAHRPAQLYTFTNHTLHITQTI